MKIAEVTREQSYSVKSHGVMGSHRSQGVEGVACQPWGFLWLWLVMFELY